MYFLFQIKTNKCFCLQLFDFIVNNLYEFLDTRKMTEMILKLKIGFTFSFPTKVDKGKVSFFL